VNNLYAAVFQTWRKFSRKLAPREAARRCYPCLRLMPRCAFADKGVKVCAYKRVTVMFCIVVFSTAGVSAQSDTIFAPFATQLTADVSNRTVRLQWNDSPSVKGPVYIYRSREPFSGTGAQYQSRSSEVPYGRQSFVEEVEALGMWYYLVMASDETRMKYEMVVPYNNVVDVQLDGSTKTITSGGTIADSTPYVDQAIISQPALRAAEDPAWDSTYGSYGVARQNGYSSYSNDIVNLAAQALPDGVGQGASGAAYSPAPAGAQSNTYIEPGSGYFSTVRTPSPLTAEASQAVQSLQNRPERAPVVPKSSYGINVEPRVFNQDIQNTASGEDFDLSTIVRGSFFRKDWAVARADLQQYLSSGRSAATAARARFYLGQCCYFLGDAKAALNEFMAVHPVYPVEAAVWVQAALSKIGEQR
jgi:hypothetical protein